MQLMTSNWWLGLFAPFTSEKIWIFPSWIVGRDAQVPVLRAATRRHEGRGQRGREPGGCRHTREVIWSWSLSYFRFDYKLKKNIA